MAGYDDFSTATQPSTSPYDDFSTAAPLRNRIFENPEDEALYQSELAKIREDRSKPRVPTPDDELSPEDLARNRVMQLRGREYEQQQFDASRTPLKRATDASTFALSAPIRALTRGEYGLGDVAGLVSDEAKDIYTGAEGDFVRANRDWLEPVAQAGEASIAIPFLNTMGAVPGQVLRTGAAAARQVTSPITNRLLRSGPRAAPAATPSQAYGPAQRIIDRQAFVDESIPEFPPAFTSKGTARTARTIEELPIVGGTVKTPKLAVEQAMAERQGQIAQRAGAAGSQEEVGRITQGGLSRFRGSNLQDLERSRVQGLGLTADRPPRRVGGNVDINRPSRLDTSQLTDQQLVAAGQSRVNLPGSTRSTIEDLTPQEVNRIISRPARDTSFATKASALYRRAEDAIPPLMREDATANSNLLATRNSQRVIDQILRGERSAEISGGIAEGGRFGQLAAALRNPQRNFTLDSLRAARTEIGRALSNFGDFDARLDRTQLKQLYGALSDDYQASLIALAARARRNSRLPTNNPAHVPVRVANAADRAFQQYRVADRYYRQGIERMDRFMRVLGAETMEQASKRIASYLKENTQNIQALESMASALRPEEWRSVLGHVIDGLGRLTPGAREAERVFSFERFATDFNKMSQNPRVMALLRRSLGRDVVRSLENLGRIAERMKFYETTKNYSGTAYTGFGGAGIYALTDPTMWIPLLGSVAGSAAMGKILTSRSFARWVNSLNRAQVRVGSSVGATKEAIRPHIRRLISFAAREPDPEVAAAMAGLGYLLDQQLEAASRQQSSPQQ